MEISSRKFSNPEQHHTGWFRVFRFKGTPRGSLYEIWFGKTYWTFRR